MPKKKTDNEHCPACGKAWTEHPGIVPTCKAYRLALALLHVIAEARNDRALPSPKRRKP